MAKRERVRGRRERENNNKNIESLVYREREREKRGGWICERAWEKTRQILSFYEQGWRRQVERF